MATLTMNRASLREKLVYGTAYTGFFVFAFVISVYLTFPYDRLSDYIVSRMDRSTPDAPLLQIGDLSPSWITGVSLEDVTLTRPAVGTKPAVKLHVDAITLRAAVMPLLLGTKKITFAAEVGDGTMSGGYAQSETTTEIDADLDELDLNQLGLGDWFGVPLKGRATGNVDLLLDTEPAKSNGEVAIKIEGMNLGDGKTKVDIAALGMPGGLTVDTINAGTLDLGVKVTDGVGNIERFTTDGPDIKVKGSGTLRLASPLPRTRVDLLLDFKFSDAYKNKSDRTKAMFMLLETPMRRATDADGTMHMHASGSAQALRAAPGGGGAAARGTRASARKRARGSSSIVNAAQPPAGDESPEP